jgi:hypothetical protein
MTRGSLLEVFVILGSLYRQPALKGANCTKGINGIKLIRCDDRRKSSPLAFGRYVSTNIQIIYETFNKSFENHVYCT